MKHTARFILAAIFVFVLTQNGFTQTEDKSLLTLNRIFNSTDFSSDRFGPARFIEGGKFYTTLEASKDTPGGRDIVKYETET
ncbi:MAG: hypothetical protein Q8S39_03750, partial [Ignavibacteria bacterium]|nr:hypothetical protein [Ignavibacteria bacterium]